MKYILITGINSYIGNSLAAWLAFYPNDYTVTKISLKNESWREENFSKYDVVVHVAGIAHRKETKDNAHLYYEINRDLTIELANKATAEGINQFIFLSTMSVYGVQEGVIDEDTPLNPDNHYGRSKLQAEEQINSLSNDKFKVAILRPPMIYGKSCKGNYQRLRSLALKTPVFPNINNKRSMIYIDNLNKYIRILIDKNQGGIFCPQNKEYVNTSEMVRLIAQVNGKQLKLTKAFNPIINTIPINTVKKVFGDLVYAHSDIERKQVEFIDFNDSIKLTEE